MQEIEKILEEIDERINYYRDNAIMEYVDVCAGLRETQKIIRKHMNDGWISTEERLPKNKGGKTYDLYLVTLENGDVCLGVYRDDENEWYVRMSEGEMYYNNNHVVTAWRLVPEPYRPERSE